MSKRHLKTMNAPRAWAIERKNKVWITRPDPGPHSFEKSMPLAVIFTDLLKYAKTNREVRKILNRGIIKVNGNIRKNHKFPVGIFDIIELPDETYRVLYTKTGKFTLDKTDKKERDLVLYKIRDKKLLRGNKVQINLSNGENLIVDNKNIRTGDTVLLKDKKIKEILKFDKGVHIYLTGGKHIGITGKLDGIFENHITFSKGKEKYETLKKYGFVIGKDKSMIKISENE